MRNALLGCTAALLAAGCASYDYGYGVGTTYSGPDYYAYSTPSYYAPYYDNDGYAPYYDNYYGYGYYSPPLFSGGVIVQGGGHRHESHGGHGWTGEGYRHAHNGGSHGYANRGNHDHGGARTHRGHGSARASTGGAYGGTARGRGSSGASGGPPTHIARTGDRRHRSSESSEPHS
jgi:hypothetical protein